MFCRNCGKELIDKAVACVGCGMDPHDGTAHCPACGVVTKDKQIMCTSCGVALKAGRSTAWSTGAYVGLLILSFLLPPFGWIFGGIQANKAGEGSDRKRQAWHFVIAGFAGLVLNLMIMGSES